MIDQALKNLLDSILQSQKETDRQMKETDRQMNKTDKQIQKTDRQMNETDKKIQETNDQIKATGEQMKETDRKLKSIGIHLGNISNNQGEVAEEFFINSIGAHQNVGGIQYDMMYNNLSKRVKNIQDEFDIVLINCQAVALIEIKYKLHFNDIEILLNQKITSFKTLYPEYKNYDHHLGLASFKIQDDIKKEALKNNIMIFQRKGDIVESFLPHNN